MGAEATARASATALSHQSPFRLMLCACAIARPDVLSSSCTAARRVDREVDEAGAGAEELGQALASDNRSGSPKKWKSRGESNRVMRATDPFRRDRTAIAAASNGPPAIDM